MSPEYVHQKCRIPLIPNLVSGMQHFESQLQGIQESQTLASCSVCASYQRMGEGEGGGDCGHGSSVQTWYSGYRGNFVAVGGVLNLWSIALFPLLPVPAGEGDHEQYDASQQHTAPAEVEGQFIGLGPVEKPTCNRGAGIKEKKKERKN